MMQTVTALQSANAAQLLFQWLGSFWTATCEDSELVRRIQLGNGILTARIYREFLDTLKCNNRYDCPVYHNKLIMPFTLFRSNRNQGKSAAIKLNSVYNPVIGAQSGRPFKHGAYAAIGGQMALDAMYIYDIDDNLYDVKVITDSITEPTIILLRDINFYVENGAIYFLDSDPFSRSDKSKPIYKQDGEVDYSITLFAFNALLDRKYIYNHLGYVVGLHTYTSEEYKTAANALWDTHNFGPTNLSVSNYIGAILGEPFVLNETETVEAIIATSDYNQVVTDLNVYTVNKNAVLRDTIQPRAVLSRGEFITKTIRIYDNVDYSRLVASNEFSTAFQTDVPALYLPTSLFRASMRHGIGISNELTDIIHAGFDSHGVARFKFNLYGNQADIDSFWSDIFTYCDEHEIDMATLFAGYMDTSYVNHPGAICGRLYPLKFFVYNFFKAGLYIVVVDIDKLSKFGSEHFHEIMQLRPILPAHTLLVVIVKHTVGPEKYMMDSSVTEGYNQYVAKFIREFGYAGPYASKRHLTYNDSGVRLQWVPVCKE